MRNRKSCYTQLLLSLAPKFLALEIPIQAEVTTDGSRPPRWLKGRVECPSLSTVLALPQGLVKTHCRALAQSFLFLRSDGTLESELLVVEDSEAANQMPQILGVTMQCDMGRLSRTLGQYLWTALNCVSSWKIYVGVSLGAFCGNKGNNFGMERILYR